MKKIIIVITLLTIGSLTLLAQPHPPSTANNGGSNGVVGGSSGAPVGNGTLILLVLASAYAGRKIYVVNVDGKQE